MKEILFRIVLIVGLIGLVSTVPGAARSEGVPAPVTPDASPEVKALLGLLLEISGKCTLTGQHNYPNTKDSYTRRAAQVCGKIPAVFGQDFGFAAPGNQDAAAARPDIIAEIKRQHEKGSIITLCWHAVRPTDDEPVDFRGSVQGKLTDQQWADLLKPGTDLHERWCAQVDVIAGYLKELQGAHIPVLWRPYHEMNGDWFWWGGRRGTNGTIALYRQLFDRFQNRHHLNNLLWVWSVDRPIGPQRQFADYFPGINYLDVTALDVYQSDFKQDYYEGLLKLSAGKPMALAEVGPAPMLPVIEQQPRWAWWMTWAGFVGGRRGGDTNALRELVNAPRSWSLNDPAYRAAIAPIHGSLRLTGARSGTIQLGARAATIRKLDTLPYVQSEHTELFRFDAYTNPKLKELRQRYTLDEVVAPGRDEFERQVLLLDWVHHQFKKFGRPSKETTDALEILKGIDEGQSYFCVQYAHLYASAAASLGWVDRELALRRHQDPPGGGSTEHLTTEIWSNQHRKWIMMDPTANMHLEKDGVPLNGFEIRQEWFYHEGTNLVFTVGKERKQYRKADLPIFLGRFAGFGDLTVPADELCKYGFIGYIPNTDLMDSRPDYGKMFIVKDKLCEGTRWHTRKNPTNPAVDPYFPINQAALSLVPEQAKVRVNLQTMTPNFQRYEARIDGGAWAPTEAGFLWNIHAGSNRLELRTVNRFGVTGPLSMVEIEQ
jgi:mannan endo-1,4-beta-mannosidase